jgi:hypothetical protein
MPTNSFGCCALALQDVATSSVQHAGSHVRENRYYHIDGASSNTDKQS